MLRPKTRRIVVFAVASAVVVFLVLYRLWHPSALASAGSVQEGLFYCTRVIDGDTIVVSRAGSVRLIGIDAPEMNYDIGIPQPFAREAKQLCERLVADKWVRLEFDIEKRDQYGRLLAYVFVDDTLVNAKLVEKGFAKAYSISPNTKYKYRFERLERGARQGRLGLWSD